MQEIQGEGKELTSFPCLVRSIAPAKECELGDVVSLMTSPTRVSTYQDMTL